LEFGRHHIITPHATKALKTLECSYFSSSAFGR
jgi:hypothetical protein